MEVFTSVAELAEFCNGTRSNSLTLGFVPTMGFLHDGHSSLFERAVAECDVAIVSVFVNPTQFGPNEDLDRYPRDIDADIERCKKAGVNALFYPSIDEIYPDSYAHKAPQYPQLTTVLCGQFRPGHFDGVLQVMNRLLSIVNPDRCYMGRKDAQQLLLIQRLAKDYFPKLEIIGCPIIREEDNVAMSSRNVYLSPQEREKARSIYIELSKVAEAFKLNTEVETLLDNAKRSLQKAGLEPQYFELVSRDNLSPQKVISDGEYLLCTAALCGTTRLIDNFFIDVKADGEIFIDRGRNINQCAVNMHG